MNAEESLVEAARLLAERGLNTGTSGNVSVRVAEGFVITPSAIEPDQLDASLVVTVDEDGNVRSGGTPSTEWRIHRDVYAARTDAGAIVHTHSTYATALASLREDLPPFHYLVGKAGGDVVRCARYATYGTQALSDAVISALGDRRACLMANHGMLAYGRDLASAVALATDIEVLCRQYLIARSAGSPVLLTSEEMAEALMSLRGYGRGNGGEE